MPNTLLMLLRTTRLGWSSTSPSTLALRPARENSMNDSSTISRHSWAASRRASSRTAGRSTDKAVGLFGVTSTATFEPARRADSANASRSSSRVTGSSGTRSSCSGRNTFSYSLNDGTGIVIVVMKCSPSTLISSAAPLPTTIPAGIALGPLRDEAVELVLTDRVVGDHLGELVAQVVEHGGRRKMQVVEVGVVHRRRSASTTRAVTGCSRTDGRGS